MAAPGATWGARAVLDRPRRASCVSTAVAVMDTWWMRESISANATSFSCRSPGEMDLLDGGVPAIGVQPPSWPHARGQTWRPSETSAGAMLLDLDGTLVDTNYHHGIAWYRAFRAHGIVLPLWQIHRHVGMGGDLLVPALVGEERDARDGDSLRTAHGEQYDRLVDEVEPLEGAHDLLATLAERGHELVLASSSQGKYLDRYLDLLDAHELIDAATTSDDVETSKPAPDLVEVAKDEGRRRRPPRWSATRRGTSRHPRVRGLPASRS